MEYQVNNPSKPKDPLQTYQEDLAEILRNLGIGDHARSISPHEVVQTEILPAIRMMMSNTLPLDVGPLRFAIEQVGGAAVSSDAEEVSRKYAAYLAKKNLRVLLDHIENRRIG